MKLGEIAEGQWSLDPETASIGIEGVASDSRLVRPGFLFVSLSRSAGEAQRHVAEAEAKGARVILRAAAGDASAGDAEVAGDGTARAAHASVGGDRTIRAAGGGEDASVGAGAVGDAPGSGGGSEGGVSAEAEAGAAESGRVPIVSVPFGRAALAKMAARFHPLQPEGIVAITGTSGKTSAASFARQLWSLAGHSAVSIGTLGVQGKDRKGQQVESLGMSSLTTPDPVELHRLLDSLTRRGVEYAALEASSHGLDQNRIDGVRLSAGAFLNLGRDHMDYHRSERDYFDAKMRLFRELLPKNSPAIVCGTGKWANQAARIARESGLDVRSVGRKGEFIRLKGAERKGNGWIAHIEFAQRTHRIEFPLPGAFQLDNALCAAALAISTGAEPEEAFDSLSRLETVPGRLELVGIAHGEASVYVDYAHKPEALEKTLEALRPFARGRLMVLFGCGGERDPGKRPLMGKIAARKADLVIVSDDNPRRENPASIRAGILEACPGGIEIADRREAIRSAVAMMGEGDLLVIAGKGHERIQIVGERSFPFCDRKEALEALEETSQ